MPFAPTSSFPLSSWCLTSPPLLPDARARASAWRTTCSNWLALLRKDGTVTEPEGYGDWRSLELAIKDAAKKAARLAGPGVSAATVDAQIRQARYDRFLSRVFARGEQSEWLLKGGMSMSLIHISEPTGRTPIS